MLLDSFFAHVSVPTALVAFVLIYTVGLIVSRLYFSPIAHFPGPKLWAISFWPEFYYDIVRRGRFSWEILAMHEKYGPIIRINPNELHIADPDYYDTVYTGASRVTDKYPPSASRFGNTASFFSTVDHYEHRRLRAPISPFFSKQSILKFSDDILNVVDDLLERLRGCADKGKLVDLRDAYVATTADIITEYSFCKKKNALQHEDFMPMLFKGAIQSAEMTHVFFQMPWVLPMMNLFPGWLVKIMSPGVGFVMDWLAVS